MKLPLTDICSWYDKNTNTTIPLDFFIYMVSIGLVGDMSQSSFEISSFNDLLLEKYNDEFVIDDNDKFVVRDSRLLAVQRIIKEKEEQQIKIQEIAHKPLPQIIIPQPNKIGKKKKQIPKFKIVSLDKGKVNFIKL